MATLLLRNARLIVTMAPELGVVEDASIFCRGNVIEAVGPASEVPASADTVLDTGGFPLCPGFVCTHHHLYQGIVRCLPAGQQADLEEWLAAHHALWRRLDDRMISDGVEFSIARGLLSGCTTIFDQQTAFAPSDSMDASFDVAAEMGVRYIGGRGFRARPQRDRGVLDDRFIETPEQVVHDLERLVAKYHGAEPLSMAGVAAAPANLRALDPDLGKQLFGHIRSLGLRIHSHLAESIGDVEACRDELGCTPAEYAERLSCVGRDVCFAHCVHLSAGDMAILGRSGTGVSHCPGSNARVGAGIADVGGMQAAGIQVGLGIDGPASSESMSMLDQMSMALLLQRVRAGSMALSAPDVLTMATSGGAAVMGRSDLGALRPGMAADVVGIDLSRYELAGATFDPVAAVVHCRLPNVDLSVVDGVVRVRNGVLVDCDVERIVARVEESSRRLVAHGTD